jgi:hypothetical protein
MFKRESVKYCCQGEYGHPYAPCGLFAAVLVEIKLITL